METSEAAPLPPTPVGSDGSAARAPLRVVHLIVGLAVGGAERALVRLIEDTRGTAVHTVLVLTDIDAMAAPMLAAGAQVRHIGSRRGRISLALVRAACTAIIEARPDVVHAWMWHACALWSACSFDPRVRRVPCVWGIRASLERGDAPSLSSRLALRAARMGSGRAEAIVYNSVRARQQHEASGFAAARALTVHNGVEVRDPGWVAERRAELRARIGATEGQCVFMHVGRPHPDKGVVAFLRAAQEVRARFPSARFVRVGTPSKATGQEAEAAQMERSEWLLHAGEQADPMAWLAAADVCVMSSTRESCPNVVIESMAVGTPVIATDVGDAQLLVAQAGWVVPARDQPALAAAMCAAAAEPPEARRARGALGRARVSAEFRREAVAARYLQLWRDVIRRRAAAPPA